VDEMAGSTVDEQPVMAASIRQIAVAEVGRTPPS